MDKTLGDNIKINGNSRNESETLTFSGIPSSHSDTAVMETVATERNSFTVDFGTDVDLNVIEFPTNTAGNEIYIIIKDGEGKAFQDSDGNDITDVIPITGGQFVLPENFPLTDIVTVIVVSATDPSFVVNSDFLGCIPPRMYTLIYTVAYNFRLFSSIRAISNKSQ